MTTGLGIWRPRSEREYGPLARIVRAYRLDFVFDIGGAIPPVRYGTPRRSWLDEEEFLAAVEDNGWSVVALETPEKAPRSLGDLVHPEHALYLLGPDNGTLPGWLLRRCHEAVHVETPDERPLPNSVIGGIVAHDRYISARRDTTHATSTDLAQGHLDRAGGHARSGRRDR